MKHFRRIRWTIVPVAAVAIAAPVAQAQHAAGESAAPQRSAAASSGTYPDVVQDRLGPKFGRAPRTSAPGASVSGTQSIGDLRSQSGFDWGDAAIGGAAVACALALGVGVRRRRRPPVRAVA